MKLKISLSALKPSQYRPLVKGWDKNRYAKLFKPFTNDPKAYRIYFPLQKLEHKELPIDKSQPPAWLHEALHELQYVVVDYPKGLCRKTDSKDSRVFKIGRVLQQAGGKYLNVKQSFENDANRKQAHMKENMLVCISRHPYDIAGMSTGRGWDSCMTLDSNPGSDDGGINKHYVLEDIREGSIVAYLVDETDKNIAHPKARLMIKPFLNVKDSRDMILVSEDTIYGEVSAATGERFKQTINNWLLTINGPAKTAVWRMNVNLYRDSVNAVKLTISKNVEEIVKRFAELDDVQTVDQIADEKCRAFVRASLDTSIKTCDSPTYSKGWVSAAILDYVLFERVKVDKNVWQDLLTHAHFATDKIIGHMEVVLQTLILRRDYSSLDKWYPDCADYMNHWFDILATTAFVPLVAKRVGDCVKRGLEHNPMDYVRMIEAKYDNTVNAESVLRGYGRDEMLTALLRKINAKRKPFDKTGEERTKIISRIVNGVVLQGVNEVASFLAEIDDDSTRIRWGLTYFKGVIYTSSRGDRLIELSYIPTTRSVLSALFKLMPSEFMPATFSVLSETNASYFSQLFLTDWLYRDLLSRTMRFDLRVEGFAEMAIAKYGSMGGATSESFIKFICYVVTRLSFDNSGKVFDQCLKVLQDTRINVSSVELPNMQDYKIGQPQLITLTKVMRDPNSSPALRNVATRIVEQAQARQAKYQKWEEDNAN